MKHPIRLLIRRPGQTGARREIRECAGRGLELIAQAGIHSQTLVDFGAVLNVQGEPPLGLRHERRTGGDLIGCRRTTRQI